MKKRAYCDFFLVVSRLVFAKPGLYSKLSGPFEECTPSSLKLRGVAVKRLRSNMRAPQFAACCCQKDQGGPPSPFVSHFPSRFVFPVLAGPRASAPAALWRRLRGPVRARAGNAAGAPRPPPS